MRLIIIIFTLIVLVIILAVLATFLMELTCGIIILQRVTMSVALLVVLIEKWPPLKRRLLAEISEKIIVELALGIFFFELTIFIITPTVDSIKDKRNVEKMRKVFLKATYELEERRKHFDQFDKNRDNQISEKEFSEEIKNIKGFGDEQIYRLNDFQILDENGDKSLFKEEFLMQ